MLRSRKLLRGSKSFSGVDRRFSIRGQERGVTVVDDYGHHPNRNQSNSRGCQAWLLMGSIRVLFQPHRFSRTKYLLDEFGTAFHQADDVYLLDIYAASEPAIEGIDSQVLLEKVRSYGHRSAHYVASLEEGVKSISPPPRNLAT